MIRQAIPQAEYRARKRRSDFLEVAGTVFLGVLALMFAGLLFVVGGA